MDVPSFQRLIVLVFFFLLISSVSITNASNVRLGARSDILDLARSSSGIAVRQEQLPNCGFSGNSDVYGLGICVGYYTQGFAAWFASYFVHSEVDNLKATNILFVFATFLGLVLISLSSTTYTVGIRSTLAKTGLV